MDQRSLYLIRQAITAIFKRRMLVALVFLVIVVPFSVISLTSEAEFRAEAKVLITRERAYTEISTIDRRSAVDNLPNDSAVNTEPSNDPRTRSGG